MGARTYTGLFGMVNVLEHGVVADGVEDDTDAIQAVLDAYAGWELLFPRGNYKVSDALQVGDNTSIRGSGMGVTIFRQSTTGHRLFERFASSPRRGVVEFHDFTVYGTWEGTQSLGGDSDRHFAVNGYTRVLYDNIESKYCRQMAITSAFCDEVVVRNCRVQFCARDAINLSASDRCIVTGNHIRNCDDDAVAIHTSTTQGNPPTEGHVISGNVIEDSYGVKILGAVRAKVQSNSIMRPKGYGVYIGDHGSTEGCNDVLDIIVSGNTITDVIDSAKFGGGTQRDGVYIAPSATNWVAEVQPSSPTVTLPENLHYLSNGAAAQNAGGYRIIVDGNVIAQTLPAVAAYSDWGYGEAFTAGGFSDPGLSTGFHQATIAVRYSGAVMSLIVRGNTIDCVGDGVVMGSDIVHLGEMMIVGNLFRRTVNWGVSLETASVKRGRVQILCNVFDLDPLLEHTNRESGGKWNTGQQKPGVLTAVNWEAVEVAGNTFRNINQVSHTDSDSRIIWGANRYYMQADSAYNLYGGGTTDNRGIRRPDGLDEPGARYIAESSDPTDSGYGQILSTDTSRTGSSAAMPASGCWVGGQFVRNRAVTESGSSSSKYQIVGWQRLTTGNAHVLNTDWRELRAMTGN